MWWNVGQIFKPTDPENPYSDFTNPFDQFLPWNWTSSEKRKEHRDTLRNFGLASEEDTWGNFAADLALDTITDPLTYLTFGGSAALKPAGVVAKKAGVLPKAANKLLGKTGKKLGTRRALQEGSLLDMYKPLMGGEAVDKEVLEGAADLIKKRKEYLDSQLPTDIPTGHPRYREILDKNAEELKAFESDVYSRLNKAEGRMDEILEANAIEEAAGFKRAELAEKYKDVGGEESAEFILEHQKFQSELLERMKTGDLSGSLGGVFGVVNPITGKAFVADDYIMGSRFMADSWDKSLGWLGQTPGVRFVKQHMSPKALGLGGKSAQKLAEAVYPAKANAESIAKRVANVGEKSPKAILTQMAQLTEDIVGSRLGGSFGDPQVGDFTKVKLLDGTDDVAEIVDIKDGRAYFSDDILINPKSEGQWIPLDKVRLPKNALPAAINDGIDAARLSGDIFMNVRERMEKIGLKGAFDEASQLLLPESVNSVQRAKLFDELSPLMEELSGVMHDANAKALASARAKGIKGDDLESALLSHAERYGPAKEFVYEGGRLAPVKGKVTAPRDDEIREIPELIVTQMSLDPKIKSLKSQDNASEKIAEYIKDTYYEYLSPAYTQASKSQRAKRLSDWVVRNQHQPWFASQLDKWKMLMDDNGKEAVELLLTQRGLADELELGDDIVKALDNQINMQRIDNHATNLAKWLEYQPSRRVHGYDRLKNFTEYQTSAMRLGLVAEGMQRHALNHLGKAADIGEGAVPIARALSNAGLDEKNAIRYLSEISGIDALDLADNYALPPDVAESMGKILDAHKPGEFQNSYLKAIDTVTNIWKGGMTVATARGIPLYPAFYGRNLAGGQWMNATSGHIPPSKIWDYITANRKAAAIRSQPDSQYIQDALNDGVIGHGKGLDDAAGVSSVPPSLKDYVKGVLGLDKEVRTKVNHLADELAQDPAEITSMMLESKAIGKPAKFTRDEFNKSVAWGGVLNATVEYANRMPMYIYLRDQGWSARAAADEVKKLQFDYSDLAPTEKEVFKRAFPFYTFTRKAGELMFNTLTERPGGGMGKSIKIAGKASESDAFTPQYIAEQTSVDVTDLLGAGEEGSRRYLTGLGLPYEDLMRLNPMEPTRAGQDVLSRLNPILGFGLETLSGRSFYRNEPISQAERKVSRSISDVQEMITGEQPVDRDRKLSSTFENLLSKSPFARIIGMGKDITGLGAETARYMRGDEEATPLSAVANFGIKTLLPARIKDVSKAEQMYAARDRAVARIKDLEASREAVYTPPYILNMLSPRDREEALRLNALIQAQRTGRLDNILYRQR
jgi:hypothetical protein